MAKDFEELDCWQLARELRRRVRAITEYPAARRDFDFCDDIRRSGRSAPANIAEGFRRRKPKVFAHFLDVALGSIAETKNHLGEALEAKYIGATEHAELVELAERAKRASQGLQAYLERCGKNPPRTATPRSRRPARFDGSNKPKGT